MKNQFIVVFLLFQTAFLFAQTQYNGNEMLQANRMQIVAPDTIYPPSGYFPGYASAWTQTTNYPNRINQFKAVPLNPGGIVFIGNSITEFGKDWSARFGVSGIQNRGIAGDVTEGVLARLGEIGYYKPKAVFILIGINDIFAGKTSDFVAGNILKIVNSIHLRTPSTKVYVQTILPNGTISTRPVIAATNLLLKSSALTNNFTLIDLHPLFADANDNILAAYTTDGTHLTEAGYAVWIANEKVLLNSLTTSNPLVQKGSIGILNTRVQDKLFFTGIAPNHEFKCEVYGVDGKKMQSSSIFAQNELDVSKLSPNRYILKISSKDKLEQHTFQFQKI